MASKLEYLLNRYADKTATPEEKEELMRLLQENSNDKTVQQVIDKMIAERPVAHEMSEKTAQAVLQAIFEADETPVVTMGTTPVRRMPYWRIAAAAIVLLMVTAGGLLWMNNNSKTQVAKVDKKNDVAPGGNKAVLTLADGSTIVLDNEKNGVVAQEGNAKVVKLKNGQLMYAKADRQSADANAPVVYNTLSTPKGGQYNIELPDGSKVWLNAASSITYPTTFNAKERKVQVTGEAYFEVAKLVTVKDGRRVPFTVDIVAAGNYSPPTGGARVGRHDLGQVQVLGTHFNINAYDDEEAVKTTLLEGSVKVTKDVASALLKPGEQVSLSQSSHLSHPIPVQTDAVMAWKNGVFHFENADIKTVMRQVSRWYDVEVVYKRSLDKDDPLFFEVTRNTNLSDVLRVLNLAGGARYSILDKKIIVQ
ncbi:MAG: FecR family protein [Niastella sp.]|uniref:FecR family protein n=1 Tax=Niastella sp. TaxID=1869183 RepID=UPI003899E788